MVNRLNFKAKPQYWMCAFGHQVRYSEKRVAANEAATYCFGVTSRVTCVPCGGSRKTLQTKKTRDVLYAQLVEKHKAFTGNDLTVDHSWR